MKGRGHFRSSNCLKIYAPTLLMNSDRKAQQDEQPQLLLFLLIDSMKE